MFNRLFVTTSIITFFFVISSNSFSQDVLSSNFKDIKVKETEVEVRLHLEIRNNDNIYLIYCQLPCVVNQVNAGEVFVGFYPINVNNELYEFPKDIFWSITVPSNEGITGTDSNSTLFIKVKTSQNKRHALSVDLVSDK
ncbi:hypothetical protein N9N67_05140 [Bacteriovoracaceae bacterium]|nr:hypothetical protein [Bacteriovoracaceae bacterium]